MQTKTTTTKSRFKKHSSVFLSDLKHAPWLWISVFALAFSLIFTSGYAVSQFNTRLGGQHADLASGSPRLSAATPENLNHKSSLLSQSQNSYNSCSVQHSDGNSGSMSCVIQPIKNSCHASNGELCHADLDIATVSYTHLTLPTIYSV